MKLLKVALVLAGVYFAGRLACADDCDGASGTWCKIGLADGTYRVKITSSISSSEGTISTQVNEHIGGATTAGAAVQGSGSNQRVRARAAGTQKISVAVLGSADPCGPTTVLGPTLVSNILDC